MGCGRGKRPRNRESGRVGACGAREAGLRLLQNLVSARPWVSVASPQASSALRIQGRRTNRGRGPATEFVSKGWIGGRGGLEDRLKRRSDREFGLAGVAHASSPKRWFLLPDRRRHREIGPWSRESPGTSRGGCDAHGRPMMPRLDEDSATGAGRIATRRLDADDRVRISTVRSILRAPPATEKGATRRNRQRLSSEPATREPREAVSSPRQKTQ
jgi:hypothetical protein